MMRMINHRNSIIAPQWCAPQWCASSIIATHSAQHIRQLPPRICLYWHSTLSHTLSHERAHRRMRNNHSRSHTRNLTLPRPSTSFRPSPARRFKVWVHLCVWERERWGRREKSTRCRKHWLQWT